MIILKVFDIPIMLMSYIGALKSWLYYPIFKIFGVSAYSIRIPMILCGCLSILLVKEITTRHFNPRIAAIVMVLLAADSSFVTQTRVDQGPIVLALLISLGCMHYFVKMLTEVRSIYLWTIFGLCLAGIFNKLNFIWFINSFVLAALLVYGKEIRSGILLRYSSRAKFVYLAIFTGYLVCVAYFLTLSKVFGLIGTLKLAKLPERIYFVFFELFLDQVKGSSFFNYALGNLHSDLSAYYSCFMLALVAIGLTIAFIKRREIDTSINKSCIFIATITILLFIQIIITAQAMAYWHVYVLFPFTTILCGYAISCLAGHLVATCKMQYHVALSLIMATFIVYQVYMNSIYLNFYGKPEKSVLWSSVNNDLLAYTMKQPYTFVSADWGIHNQLITFSSRADKYIEACYWLNRGTSFGDKYYYATALLNNRLFQIIQNTNKIPMKSYALLSENGFAAQKTWLSTIALDPEKRYAFILHSEESTYFRDARLNLFQQASKTGITLKLEKTFIDGNGKIIFEIYHPTKTNPVSVEQPT
jgi:hypothetical protein